MDTVGLISLITKLALELYAALAEESPEKISEAALAEIKALRLSLDNIMTYQEQLDAEVPPDGA